MSATRRAMLPSQAARSSYRRPTGMRQTRLRRPAVRYTIADKNQGGTGKANGYASSEGQLKIYVNGMLDRTVDLTSYYMYQYFSKGSGSPSQSGGTAPCFCFDEKHVRLSRVLVPGDVIKVECASGEEVGVDFIETEVVAEALDPGKHIGCR